MTDKIRAAIVDFAPEVLAKLLEMPEGAYIDCIWSPPERPGVMCMRVIGIGQEHSFGTVLPTMQVALHPAGFAVEWPV